MEHLWLAEVDKVLTGWELRITVEPIFNEVPRDWGNFFVESRVRYIEHLLLTNFQERYQNVRYIEV